MCYLDLVLIPGIILFSTGQDLLHWTSLLALMVLAVTALVPVLLLIYLCAKFENLKEKKGKEKFNTLLLKVDKEDRWRIFMPCFFFIRRYATGLMIVLGSTGSAPAYLQFAIVITLSAVLVFYLAFSEPYVHTRLNSLVILMEVIYFLLSISIFTFTDATDDVRLKKSLAIVAIVLLCAFFLCSFLSACFFACKGKQALRESDLNEKAKRRTRVNQYNLEQLNRKKKRQSKKQ